MAVIPKAYWLERFATESLKLRPELKPLDAVREALSAFADASAQRPEDAAEANFVVDQLVDRVEESIWGPS